MLRDIRYAPVNRRELARAKTTLLTRHESDLKDNAYWLGLLTHLQVGRQGEGDRGQGEWQGTSLHLRSCLSWWRLPPAFTGLGSAVGPC